MLSLIKVPSQKGRRAMVSPRVGNGGTVTSVFRLPPPGCCKHHVSLSPPFSTPVHHSTPLAVFLTYVEKKYEDKLWGLHTL